MCSGCRENVKAEMRNFEISRKDQQHNKTEGRDMHAVTSKTEWEIEAHW